MRPRHKAAENVMPGGKSCPEWMASMRPRHKAAENYVRHARWRLNKDRFNEAAA